MYTPLDLKKLCSNVIISEIYTENYDNFLINLKNLDLPDIINEIIIDRYNVIKHITKYEKY
tara:strand:- start:447 stop:629 length:183 start_codon:yes stop_codon:yes gene_type:complete